MRPYLWTKGVSITNFFRVNLAWVLPTHKKKWRIQVFTLCWRHPEKPHGDYSISNADPQIARKWLDRAVWTLFAIQCRPTYVHGCVYASIFPQNGNKPGALLESGPPSCRTPTSWDHSNSHCQTTFLLFRSSPLLCIHTLLTQCHHSTTSVAAQAMPDAPPPCARVPAFDYAAVHPELVCNQVSFVPCWCRPWWT